IPGFGRIDQRRIDVRQIAVRLHEGASHACNRRGRWFVGNEVTHQFGCDESSGRGVPCEVLEHRFTLGPAFVGIALAEKCLGSRFVQIVAEEKTARLTAREAPLTAANRPTGDDLWEARDILLGVATVYAQGVQLEGLARQVLVYAELALGGIPQGNPLPRPLGSGRIRSYRILIVEESEHRRMLFNRSQQVDEAAVDVRPDSLVLERAGQSDDGT